MNTELHTHQTISVTLSELINTVGWEKLVDKKHSYIMKCTIMQSSQQGKSNRSRIRKVLGLNLEKWQNWENIERGRSS